MSNIYWREYHQKLCPADEAVKVVKSGDRVAYGQIVTPTLELDKALAKRKDELHDVFIHSALLLHYAEAIKADPNQEHFTFNDISFSPIGRKMHAEGLAFHIPELLHETPQFFRKIQPSDVVFLCVTPMDDKGYFNLSSTQLCLSAALESARHVVVEVHEKLPHCYGPEQSLHISKVDYVVEVPNSTLPWTLPEASSSDIDLKIAAHIIGEIEDGACLQLGIGGTPNAIGKMMADSDLKDLGVHTEMFVDSYVDLFQAGKITNLKKQIDKGISIYNFAMGSNRLYEFLDRNPTCSIAGADYTNDPFIVAQNDKVISICSCLNVDILGQISSESVGRRQISGTGGQLDFHFAAFRSKGGKGIVCMPSTSENKLTGELRSNIVASFIPGTAITVPRSMTGYVATEYGIANLKGKSTWERAEALVSLAHPNFRDELITECKDAHIWVKSNK